MQPKEKDSISKIQKFWNFMDMNIPDYIHLM